MSNYQKSHATDDPRVEPWLAVMASSLIPVIAAIYLPRPFLAALIALGGILYAAGLVMLRMQTAQRVRPRAVYPTPEAMSIEALNGPATEDAESWDRSSAA